MLLKFIGTHNAQSLNTNLISIVVDNVLAIDAGSLASRLTFAEQQQIRSILLSHSHYDHICEIPAFAFNNVGRTIKIFGTAVTLDILVSHLMDGIIYPKFTEKLPFTEKQVLELCQIEPMLTNQIEEYQIRALPTGHSFGAVGFEVLDKDGKSIFYTGDAGGGLSSIWPHTSPDILIVDLTFPNELENTAVDSNHMCPRLLGIELVNFNGLKGYFPRVIPVHLSPKYEDEIRKEIDGIAQGLGISIINVHDGTELNI